MFNQGNFSYNSSTPNLLILNKHICKDQKIEERNKEKLTELL